MKHAREGGYILASVTVVMAALAIVASALMVAAVGELRRVAAAEQDVVERALIRTAMLQAARDVAVPPQARVTSFENGVGEITLNDRVIRLTWVRETDKVDLFRAPPPIIVQAAISVGISPGMTSDLLARVTTLRRDQEGPYLIDAILPEGMSAPDCAHQVFTVFGGADELRDLQPPDGVLPRAAPGSRWALTARLEAGERTETAVFLFTGNAREPVQVMDWREHSSNYLVGWGDCSNET